MFLMWNSTEKIEHVNKAITLTEDDSFPILERGSKNFSIYLFS